MLIEERFAAILSILQRQRTITVLGLTQALSVNESTIWRSLIALHRTGELKEIRGGAMLLHKEYGLYKTEVATRSEEHVEEKKRIVRYAVSLIQVHNPVYINAGSITLHMVEYLKEEGTTYVANRLEHGGRLVAQDFRTFLLVGELKSKMETVVGLGVVPSLQKYNFNRAFFGTNGITVDSSFTIPNTNETYVKMEAVKHTQKRYVFADSGRFRTYTSIIAADISDTTIITGKGTEEEYLKEADIVEVEE